MTTLRISTESQRFHVATDKDRSNLKGIYFNCKNVIATNGHYLVMRRKQEGEPSNQIIALDKVKKKGLPEFHAVGEGFMNGEGTKAEVLDAQFPDVDQVLNNLSTKTVRLAINPRQLFEIAQAAGIDKESQATITLEIPLPDDGESAVSRAITLQARDVVGVIMPMKTADEPHKALADMRA